MHLQENLVESGFQLAYFLLPDREVALAILTGALNKLELQHGRESRRSYWRDKHLKRSITRITRDQGDALQWLICFESEAYERAQEAETVPSLEQMQIRYVKSLVRITTAMSSFHVNVGLQRLLYCYTTEEAQRFYESLTDRFLGADEYRRAKAALMQKLQQRFGSFLETTRGQHGELRFASADAQEQWPELLERCLAVLTPWSTSGACPIPSDFAVRSSKLPPQLSIEAASPFNADRIEINRCHAFIDPTCFGRLAKALALDPPFTKLALPRFNMPNESDHSGPTRPPDRLTPREHEQIHRGIELESIRRGKAAPSAFQILVDGDAIATLGTENQMVKTAMLREGAELIEIFGIDSPGDVALGICPLAYDHFGAFMPAELGVRTDGGTLRVSVVPDRDAHTATLSMAFDPEYRRALFVDRQRPWLMLPKFVVPILAALVVGFVLGRFEVGRRPAVVNSEDSVKKSQPNAAAAPALETERRPTPAKQETPPLVVVLVPDEFATRSVGGASSVNINLPQTDALVRFRLPIAANLKSEQFSASLKTFLGEESLVSESGLSASMAGGRVFVEVPVRSALLHGNDTYTFTLGVRSATQDGQEVGSFTFHASSPQR